MKKVVIGLVIGILLVGGLMGYLNFFYETKCETLECWDYHLSNCKRAEFVNSKPDLVWRYTIIGKKGNNCIVNAEIVRVITGLADRRGLEGKSMECGMPLGVIDDPERNIGKCSGKLKEEMQNMIIQKLHEYIVDNLGEINEELLDSGL